MYTEAQGRAMTSISVGQETEQLLASVLEGKRRGRRKEVGRSLRKTTRTPKVGSAVRSPSATLPHCVVTTLRPRALLPSPLRRLEN